MRQQKSVKKISNEALLLISFRLGKERRAKCGRMWALMQLPKTWNFD